jgi:hypothetical protein
MRQIDTAQVQALENRLAVMGISPNQYPRLHARLPVSIDQDDLACINELVLILEDFSRNGHVGAPSQQRAFWGDD